MVRFKKAFIEEIRDQGLKELPNEACGYLYGKDLSNLDGRIAMENIDFSPEHFSFASKDMFLALKTARSEDKALLAVYHTHPETPARMSEEDKRLANDTSMVYLIYSLSEDQIKSFTINKEKQVQEVDFEVFE